MQTFRKPPLGNCAALRTRLAAEVSTGNKGQFEILAITTGVGNGWQFDAPVLERSLSLWDGVKTFIDHAASGRSLRDLAGISHSPRWDGHGVRLTLRPFGPSAALLKDLGQQMLEGSEPRPHIGFSADILFSVIGCHVEKILEVLSLDLVLEPARGGMFLTALGQVPPDPNQPNPERNEPMSENPENTPLPEAEPTPEPAASALETALLSAHLPAPALDALRRQFAGSTPTPAELRSAIENTRRLAAELTAPAAIRGPAISGMASSTDMFTAAVHDLLGAPRPEGLERLHTARLSGIRELYTLMTGDTGFLGGFYPERTRLAVSTDLPGVLKNALNKLIIQQWQELGRAGYRWWEPVVSVEHFTSLHPITGVLVGEVTVLPEVSEGDAYIELALSDSPETGSWTKYGGYVGLTLEMFERDETHKLRQYPQKLASAALRRISSLVGAVFTASSGTGPTMTDTYHVFDAAHHANLGTTALSGTSFEAASKAIYSQSMVVASGGTAPKLALDARYLIVPRDLRLTAMRILYPTFEREASIFSENMQRGEMGDVITCPEFTDANDWAAAADPRLAPAIILGERFGLLPEIFIADNALSGALFTNDQVRIKVRHWVSVFVADHRPLYKANVA